MKDTGLPALHHLPFETNKAANTCWTDIIRLLQEYTSDQYVLFLLQSSHSITLF